MLSAALFLAVQSPAIIEPASAPVDRALAAREAGDYRTAIALLEAERRIRPDDATILRLLGTTYAFAGRYDDAIALLSRARAIAPGDQDVALALARAYLWAGRLHDASAIADAVEHAEPSNPELGDLKSSIFEARRGSVGDERRPALTLIQSVSDVAFDRGGKATWHGSAASLAIPVSPRVTVTASADRESRKGIVDTRLELRADARLGDAGSAYVVIAGTPRSDFRERWGVRVGGEAAIARHVSGTLDLRYLEYRGAQVIAIEPGIRVHAADDHWALAVKSINLWNDGYRSGWSVRGEIQASDAVRIVAGGATYPDTEAGVTRRTRSAFFGVVVALGERATLRATYEHDRRVQTYRRNGVIAALSFRF